VRGQLTLERGLDHERGQLRQQPTIPSIATPCARAPPANCSINDRSTTGATYEVCDRHIVMNHGRKILDVRNEDTSVDELTAAFVEGAVGVRRFREGKEL